MIFHIISIFPESFDSFLSHSIVGRARERGLFTAHIYNLCDYSQRPTRRVDAKAYGMHGQVLECGPLSSAIESIFQTRGKIPVVYMTPGTDYLTQEQSEDFFHTYDECIILCGHYEGIDQRIVDKYVDYQVCIGGYILSGGELAAQVFMDTLIRQIPGVLGNTLSLEEESFSQTLGRKTEYPVYTRPENFEGLMVPSILLSGDHKKIQQWKENNIGVK